MERRGSGGVEGGMGRRPREVLPLAFVICFFKGNTERGGGMLVDCLIVIGVCFLVLHYYVAYVVSVKGNIVK